MSGVPSRLEMYKNARPSGSQAGLRLMYSLAEARCRRPDESVTTHTVDADWLFKLGRTPSRQTSLVASLDQATEWKSCPSARRRGAPPPIGRTHSPAPSA